MGLTEIFTKNLAVSPYIEIGMTTFISSKAV